MDIFSIKLSQKAIEEFRQIWKQEFGEEISCEYAEMRGKELVHLFKVIYRPLPDHHSDIRHKERKGYLPNKTTLVSEEKPDRVIRGDASSVLPLNIHVLLSLSRVYTFSCGYLQDALRILHKGIGS